MLCKSRLWRILAVTACVGGFALYARAQVPQIPANCAPVNNLPAIIANASVPLDAAPNAQMKYEVTATDMDTLDEFAPPLAPERIQISDSTCRARPVNARSLRPDFIHSFRGTDTQWKCMWDIAGAASRVPGVYVDTWQIYNARPDNDLLKDKSVTVYQIVRVHAPASSNPVPSDTVPPITAQMRPQEKDALNARESASSVLKTKLRRMAVGLPLRRIDKNSLQIQVDSLPTVLRTEAKSYVDAVLKEMRANVSGFAALDNTRGFTLEYDPEAGCIAIEGYTSDGTLWTF